jgi:hypothetical protein
MKSYVEELQEDRYRIFGSEGTEQEVKEKIAPRSWPKGAVEWLYETVLKMCPGADPIYEYAPYPGFSWKVQVAIVDSFIELGFLPVSDTGNDIWNSLHISLTYRGGPLKERLVRKYAPWTELANVLLFASPQRMEYFEKCILEPLKDEDGYHNLLAIGQKPWRNDPDHLQESYRRLQYRTGEVGPGRLWASRLRATQILHGLMTITFDAALSPEVTLDGGRLEFIRIYDEFIRGMEDLATHHPEIKLALAHNWFGQDSRSCFAPLYGLKKNPEALRDVQGLLHHTLLSVEKALDRWPELRRRQVPAEVLSEISILADGHLDLPKSS